MSFEWCWTGLFALSIALACCNAAVCIQTCITSLHCYAAAFGQSQHSCSSLGLRPTRPGQSHANTCCAVVCRPERNLDQVLLHDSSGLCSSWYRGTQEREQRLSWLESSVQRKHTALIWRLNLQKHHRVLGLSAITARRQVTALLIRKGCMREETTAIDLCAASAHTASECLPV